MTDPCAPIPHTAATLRRWAIWRASRPGWRALTVPAPDCRAVPGALPAMPLSGQLRGIPALLPVRSLAAAALGVSIAAGVAAGVGVAVQGWGGGVAQEQSSFGPRGWLPWPSNPLTVTGPETGYGLSPDCWGSCGARRASDLEAGTGGLVSATGPTGRDVFYIPKTPQSVPEPASVLVLAAALVFARVVGRRG